MKAVLFHTIKNGEVDWQGKVLRELPLGHLKIQLFSAIDGRPTDIKTVDGKDYEWRFYDNEYEWRGAYEESFKRIINKGRA